MSHSYINAVISSNLTGSTKSVAFILANRANDLGSCWPSIETIAREAGWSVRIVKKALRELEQLGLLTRAWTGHKSMTCTLADASSDLWTRDLLKIPAAKPKTATSAQKPQKCEAKGADFVKSDDDTKGAEIDNHERSRGAESALQECGICTSKVQNLHPNPKEPKLNPKDAVSESKPIGYERARDNVPASIGEHALALIDEPSEAPRLPKVADALALWNAVAAVHGWPAEVIVSDFVGARLKALLKRVGFATYAEALRRGARSRNLRHGRAPGWFCLHWLVKDPANFNALAGGQICKPKGSGRLSLYEITVLLTPDGMAAQEAENSLDLLAWIGFYMTGRARAEDDAARAGYHQFIDRTFVCPPAQTVLEHRHVAEAFGKARKSVEDPAAREARRAANHQRLLERTKLENEARAKAEAEKKKAEAEENTHRIAELAIAIASTIEMLEADQVTDPDELRAWQSYIEARKAEISALDGDPDALVAEALKAEPELAGPAAELPYHRSQTQLPPERLATFH